MIKGIAGTAALITDIERRKALPIVRALGKAGVRVIGLSYVRRPLCQYSKYCDTVHVCPDYRREPSAFLKFLREFCLRERPDVFYPIEDEVLELLARNPDSWRGLTTALIPEANDLDNAYDKWKTLQIAKQIGVSIPESYCPSDQSELVTLVKGKPDREWIVKPRKSSGSRGLAIARNSRELFDVYQTTAERFDRPIVQERLPQAGQGVGSFFLVDQESETLARFGHRRLREFPLSGGPSTLRESFFDEQLLQQSEALVKRLKCTGVSMVEYKFDENRRDFVLMEVNPRFWGSLALAIHAGVNFPVLYHMACLRIPFRPVMNFSPGMYCRWLWPGDLLHFLSNPDRFSLEPSFFRFSGPDVAYDILSKDDPWPAFGIVGEAVRKLYRHDK